MRSLASEHDGHVLGERDRSDAPLEETVLRLKGRTHHSQQRLPLIATFGSLANRGAGEHAVYTADATTIEQLLEAGGLSLLLPPPVAQKETLHLSADKQRFRQSFDQLLWPYFCQLLSQQISGLCLSTDQDPQVEQALPCDGPTATLLADEKESKRLQRCIALLAWLVGIPVLGGGQEMQSLQSKDRKAGAKRSWEVHDQEESSKLSPNHGQVANPSGLSAFIAACAAAEPPPPEALQPLQREIGDWLYQAEQALSQQTTSVQSPSGQKTGRKQQPTARLQARQQKLQDIRGKGKPRLQVRTATGAG